MTAALTEATAPRGYGQTLEVAIHEAGHAVISITLGCAIECVTILPVTELPERRVCFGKVEYGEAVFRSIQDSVVADFAGPVAAALFTDTPLLNKFVNGGAGDIESANNAALRKDEFFGLAGRSVGMVLEAWPAIQLTAAYLIEYGEMTGVDVRRFMKLAKKLHWDDERIPTLAIARAAQIARSNAAGQSSRSRCADVRSELTEGREPA